MVRRESALCHYRRLSQEVSGMNLGVDAVRAMGVVTEGLSGIQASSGKEFTKHLGSAALVTRC